MTSSIESLRDYLELYKTLLESSYYDPNYEEDAKQLLEMIDNLEDPTQIASFDYKQLRRKISKIFHPDVYTSFDTQKLGIDNVELLKKVNASIDDAIKEQKRESFQYGENDPYNDSYSDEVKEEDEDYTKNDYFGRDQRFQPKPKTEEQLRKERISNTINEIKSEMIRTKDYICVLAKERFNATFRSIPSNTKDYIVIKNRFERTLESLTFRDKVIQGSLSIFKNNKQVLEEMLKKDISPLAINYYYNNLVSHKKGDIDRCNAKLENATSAYHQVFAKYEPEYKEYVTEWINSTSEVDAALYNINARINEAIARNTDHRLLKTLYKERHVLEKKKEKCTSYEEEKEKIKAKMLEAHPDLKEVYSKYKDEQANLNTAKEELTNTINNSKAIKLNRMKEVTIDYTKRIASIDAKIDVLEMEHDSKQRKIFKTRMRYTDFLEKYQNKFENRLEYADLEETSMKR